MSTETSTFNTVLEIHPHKRVYVHYAYTYTLLISTTGSSRLWKTNAVLNEDQGGVINSIKSQMTCKRTHNGKLVIQAIHYE